MSNPFVKWSVNELPKEVGGLGVGNMMRKNLALLFNWWWRFSTADDPLWKRILLFVHRFKGLKASFEAFSEVKAGMWSQLLKNDEDTSKIRSIVEEGIKLRLGNGVSFKFWHDNWCNVGPLRVAFPRLYTISLQKHLFVSQMGIWRDGVWEWLLSWRRNLYDWENDDLQDLNSIIE